MTNDNIGTYYSIGDSHGAIYFKVLSDTEIVCRDKTVTMPIEKFLDFIHTADLLGIKTSKF